MKPTLVLASESPRRRELLASLNLPFTVHPSSLDETLRPGHTAEEEAVRLATAKAQQGALTAKGIVVAADTLVTLRDTIFEKPNSPDQATSMLRNLRDREHRVVTGVAVASAASISADHRVTPVLMRPYTDDEIAIFVASGEPLDKAGSYAIQDPSFRPVQRLWGCYCTIVGLPLGLLRKMLRDAGYPVGQVSRPPQCMGCPDW